MEKLRIRPLTPRHVCTLALPSITAGRSSSLYEGSRSRESSGSFHRKDASFSSFDTSASDNLNISSNSSVLSKHSTRTVTTTTSSTTVPLRNTRPENTRSTKGSIAGVGFASPPNAKIGSPLLIAFGEFLLVPTFDAYILVYTILDFSTDIESRLKSSSSVAMPSSFSRPNSSSSLFEEQQRLDSSEREKMKTAIEPIRIMGPLYVHQSITKNENINIPASIVAITSTPVHSKWTHVYPTVKVQDYTDKAQDAEASYLGCIAAATNEGDINLYSVYKASSREISGSSEPPIINHSVSFFTGYMGATCLTFATENHIVIGYDSGRILCFRLPLQESSTMLPLSYAELIWSGYFENPIQCVSFEGYIHKVSFPEPNAECAKGGVNFLIVGLSTKNHSNASIQPSLEVVDIDRVRDQWVALFQSGQSDNDTIYNSLSSTSEFKDKLLRMESFSLWPKPGMELRDIDWNKITKDFGDNVYMSYALSKYIGKSSIKNENQSLPQDPTLSVDCIGVSNFYSIEFVFKILMVFIVYHSAIPRQFSSIRSILLRWQYRVD